MTLCAPGAFCSLLRWFRTGAHIAVPRTFSPGVYPFLSSVPRIPRGLLVGLACQSAMLAGSNQPHRFRSTSDAAINLAHRLQNRIALPFSQHLSPLDVRFEVDDSPSDFSFPFVEIQRSLTNNISASLTYDRFEVMARARDRPAAGYAGETIQHQT